MSNQNSNDIHAPSATLQAEWIRLLSVSSILYQERDYIGAWQALLDLQSSIPIEVYEETKPEFDRINNHVKSMKIVTGSYYEGKMRLRAATWDYLRNEVLPLKRIIHSSLERKGWITREYQSIQPRSQTRPHIGD